MRIIDRLRRLHPRGHTPPEHQVMQAEVDATPDTVVVEDLVATASSVSVSTDLPPETVNCRCWRPTVTEDNNDE